MNPAKHKFELLLKQIQLAPELALEYFGQGELRELAVSRTDRTWKFEFALKRMLPLHVYAAFSERLTQSFAQIADVSFAIDYPSTVETVDLVHEYWPAFAQYAQSQSAALNGWLRSAELHIAGDEVTIRLPDAGVLSLANARKVDEIAQTYYNERLAGRAIRVQLAIVDERKQQEAREMHELRKQDEEKALMEQLRADQKAAAKAAEVAADEAADGPIQLGYDIKDEPIRLNELTEKPQKVTLQGAIFNVAKRELRNGQTLLTFIVTDYSDSVGVKVFIKNKDDLRTLGRLQEGMWVKLRGKLELDSFGDNPEWNLIPNDLIQVGAPPEPIDDAPHKRVEFHLHTKMSTMDAVSSIDEYVRLAASWGHQAIAITDHANVHAFPDAEKAAKKYGIQVMYGVEANLIAEKPPIVYAERKQKLADATYIVFDIETTGLSVTSNKIIELAAVKWKEGREVERWSTFINPHETIPFHIQQLTNISNEMVEDAPELEPKLHEFISFIADHILVAHNAKFDMGFIQAACKQYSLPSLTNPVLDTLELARYLFPKNKNHRLNTLADHYKVSLDNHHRAIDDSVALAGVLNGLLADAAKINLTDLAKLNAASATDLTNVRPFHALVFAMNETGKKNLFKLISLSHTDYYRRVPRMPKQLIEQHREGLLLVSGCEKGEFFEAVLNKSRDEAEEIAQFYDALEIQPLTFYRHLVTKGLVASEQQIIEALRTIVEIGAKVGKPVIATGNVHYLKPQDKIYRDITIHAITGFSPLKDQEKPDAHLRTTNEMLQEFEFLGSEKAFEVVVTNTQQLAERFESFAMFPKQLFTPRIEGADDEIRDKCYATARRLYGEPLPQIVVDRLEKELVPIIKYGFSANYLISERLVKKSNEDGYLVGSRGSVGSSVVATFLGISEVNPLPPHYMCTNESCLYSEFFTDGTYPSGFDLPTKSCPKCSGVLKGEGQDIPFETFLGFKGDKVPDIDLNFSGEYQAQAHNYTKQLFGESFVFRAGTIGTVAQKTAYAYASKYEEHVGQHWRSAERERLAFGCTGVKRSTGQHPGGIVVVPDYMEIDDITPVQYPADDVNAEWKTTHFDYHAFDENLLKLDILGHDDPTMMRMLQDLTGVDPTTIPMNDPKVMSLFNSTEALGVTPEQIRSKVATVGVPEMGTAFVRQMLEETKPQTFADLLQISGLSHGTGVWLGNAQELIRNGTCSIKTVIGCRDDIMLYLIYKAGMDASLAFTITESVRKGKGLKPEWIETMREHKVPKWYIESCQRIEYMFPKAHAAAYVISAVRTAYFKLYYPLEYYATYFTVRADDMDIELLCQGYDAITRRLAELENKGFNVTAKEKGSVTGLEMALEMTARGFGFKPLDLYRSDTSRFVIDGDKHLIPPFSAIPGIGPSVAPNLAGAREKGEFLSIEDFQQKAKVGKAVIETLTALGCFRGMPESNQLTLF